MTHYGCPAEMKNAKTKDQLWIFCQASELCPTVCYTLLSMEQLMGRCPGKWRSVKPAQSLVHEMGTSPGLVE